MTRDPANSMKRELPPEMLRKDIRAWWSRIVSGHIQHRAEMDHQTGSLRCHRPGNSASTFHLLLPFVLMMAAAATIRWSVIRNDLWLDEVWSMHLASEADSPWAIFTSIHHDNNHHLCTLWLRLIGEQADPIWCRLPSLIAGVLGVVLIGILTWPAGRLAAICAMSLASTSTLLVQYSTEARGYSLALMFALAAHWTLRRYLGASALDSDSDANTHAPANNVSNRSHVASHLGRSATPTGSRALPLLFGVLCLLGAASHLTFLQYYFAAVYWSTAVVRSRHSNLLETTVSLLKLHWGALSGLGMLYFLDVRHLHFGGGPQLDAVRVLWNAVSVFLGGPLNDSVFKAIYLCLMLGGVSMGLWQISRQRGQEWKFFACLFLLFIVCRVFLFPASMLFERYFVVILGFTCIPLGIALEKLLTGRGIHLIAGIAALWLIFIGNIDHVHILRERGRGQYQPAIQLLTADAEELVSVSSDHPFRNRLLIEHYARAIGKEDQIQYQDLGDWHTPPDWMICHQVPRDTDAPVHWLDKFGNGRSRIRVCGFEYRLEAHYRAGELSGCDWLCYRLTNHPSDQLTVRSGREELSQR
ncbi:MAG: hypothetical protein KDA96_04255 [Planctomycetaceae bacterium]|nr:hypothetical protein [Planctomycetaceae bacterium]